MQADEIEGHLAALGLELQRRGVQTPVRILMVGGAYMLTQLHNRPSTQDVDVLLKDIPDPSASPIYPLFKAAIHAIAVQASLPDNWLNDVVGDALRNNGVVPEGTLWRTYDMLEVYLPPAEYMLALKLFAGRDRDRDDILALCRQLTINSRQQAQDILDRYIPDQQLQQLHQVSDTLADLFP